MRTGVVVSFVLGFLAVAVANSRAAVDVAATAPTSDKHELIVVEAPGCTYCDIFRRNVLPAFAASERGKDIPVRFLDVNDVGSANLQFDGAIEMAPTFVLVKGNQEIGRVAGFVGRDTLLQSIGLLLATPR
ncbi:MAG: hypothetical protein ACT4OU_08640 [Hyphomicrobium sp.]